MSNNLNDVGFSNTQRMKGINSNAEALPSNLQFETTLSNIRMQDRVDEQLNDVDDSLDSSRKESELTTRSMIEKVLGGSQSSTPLSYGSFTLQYIIYPFLAGIMAGVGEMCALELAVLWGWRAAPIFYFGRKPKS